MKHLMEAEDQFFADFRRFLCGRSGITISLSTFYLWCDRNKIPPSWRFLLMARIGNNESNGYLINIDF